MSTKIDRLALEHQAHGAPPSPHGYPVVGALPHLMLDPARFCTRMMIEHNDLVCLDLGFGSIYLVTLPDHIHHVMVANNDNYWKGDVFERTRFLFGNGLVVDEEGLAAPAAPDAAGVRPSPGCRPRPHHEPGGGRGWPAGRRRATPASRWRSATR